MNQERAVHANKTTPISAPLASGILQRKYACGQHTLGGKECTTCSNEKLNKPLQAKLQIGEANDRYEQEADRVAEQVMRIPKPKNSNSNEYFQAKPFVQRRVSNTQSGSAEVPAIVHNVLRLPGQSLGQATRDFMEPRIGSNFSDVRIHTDAKAAESAQAVSAKAYTVGNNIVFGKGQYAPDTGTGKSLLAHELTHVLQQNVSTEDSHSMQRASSGVLQRTPAPPNYGGVTGTRDLSKIRIDAVADFLASSLTAALAVNVHVSDPAVDHISWYLYDPNNFLVSGSFFSTTRGQPDALSRPFQLQPSFFSGSGFTSGSYTLRCIGRNQRNHPLIYADRDFNVLSSDMTTGTALTTTYGDIKFTKYSKTDANPPANPNYSVDVELRFLPKSTVNCNDVTYIQSMRTIDSQGRSQQNTVNAEQDARKTPLAWSIDRVAGAPSPFYIVGRTPIGGTTDVAGWGRAGRGDRIPRGATLIDQPSWNRENIASFETCATCRSGANRGQVYGCATWGYTATAAGRVTLMPRGFRQMPSDQFEEARTAWNTWRATRPAATRPTAAPALRNP